MSAIERSFTRALRGKVVRWAEGGESHLTICFEDDTGFTCRMRNYRRDAGVVGEFQADIEPDGWLPELDANKMATIAREAAAGNKEGG